MRRLALEGPGLLPQVSLVRSGDAGATVFHRVGTGALDGLGAGWEEGRVPAPRARVRVDPGKKASAINAVRAASGEARLFYEEAVCSEFVRRLGEALSRRRDPEKRGVKERAAAGLAAVSRGLPEDKDGEACMRAACRGECGFYPCLSAKVLRVRLARARLGELGGGDVSVSGAAVVMPRLCSGGRAVVASPRRLGKSSRAARDVDASPAPSGDDVELDFSNVPPAGVSGATRRAEAAAEVNTRAAVARASAQVNGFRQQGWEHMDQGEADEVVAALALAIEGGELPLHVVHSVQDLQDAVSEQLGEVRGTAEGRAREISVLRANRCRVHAVKFRADGSKRARRASGAGATQSVSEGSEGGEGTVLTALNKQNIWSEFLEAAHDVFSRAPVFGFISGADVARLCSELATGVSMVEGGSVKFGEVVGAGLGQLEKAGCVAVSYEDGGQRVPSYTFGVGAFLGTVSGQAVVGGS